METIELNNTNCKEYTHEEMVEKVKQLTGNDFSDDNNEFDMDVLFSDNMDEVIEEKTEITPFQKLTLELLNKAKTELSFWESKNYKKSKSSIWVGSELEGDKFSFNYINNKRKNNGIKNAKADIELYTNDLKNTGYCI